MELRQLRYFVRVCELGSMGRAAADLGVVTSALSQQISRLEGELGTRLLQRTAQGVVATDAGMAFFRHAQLALRHADEAVRAAREERLSGQVSVGLAPTTASVLGFPLMQAMRERYPGVRLHLVESLSGHLTSMLNARQLDLALIFRTDMGKRWRVMPLLQEQLFLIGSTRLAGFERPTDGAGLSLSQLGRIPMILPTGGHGLRSTIDTAFAQAQVYPRVVTEIDSLALLMDAVRAGLGATIQPGAATVRVDDPTVIAVPLLDASAQRLNVLASLSDEELSPAALAARVVLIDTARRLVQAGRWPGASLL
jgi:LysR family transcriptional regulator, regulatory protein for tcuABC